MTNEVPSSDSQPVAARQGIDREPGSVPRYLAAVAAAGIVAIAWAVLWSAVFYTFHHLDIAWVNLFLGFAIGLVIRRLWGIGGAVAALTALLITIFSLGLGHLLLFEHYALTQQAADDIGIAPSFRSVMGRLSTVHWIFCACALIGALGVPLRRQ